MTQLDHYSPSPLEAQMTYAKALAASDLLPQAYRGKPANVLVALALGEALGISPTTALYGINVIQGKPTLSAETMRAIVLAHGHRFDVAAFTETEARVEVARAERPGDVSTFTFTVEDAKRAGLVGGNYEKFPKAMLLARVTSAACRAVFPDVLAGVSYTPDELDVPRVNDTGSPLDRAAGLIVDLEPDAEPRVGVDYTPEGAIDGTVDAELVDDTAPITSSLRGPAARRLADPATPAQLHRLEVFAGSVGMTLEQLLDSPSTATILGGPPSTPLSRGHASQLIDAAAAFDREAAQA